MKHQNQGVVILDKLHYKLIDQMKADGQRYWANDNISKYVTEEVKEQLITEATEAFESVLDSLLIDRHTDPNSKGTARRLAKMYYNELFRGRYREIPHATAFPNDVDSYNGMIVIRAEIKSVCSHHHQPVKGTCYIGVLPNKKVIGLSKYIRIAQWCARRGTLQEQLCNDICYNIMKATESDNVAVYLKLSHGCCENRGVSAHDSTTQTTVLRGSFSNSDVKKEFFDNIQIQELTTK